MYELDKYDEKILRALLDNSRASYRDIASDVKLSKDAVRHRISQYKEAGLLSSFLTVINQDMFADAVVCVMARTKQVSTTASSICQNNNVNWVAELMGDYDIAFTYVKEDIRGVKQEIGNLLDDQVQSYQLHLYTEEHKFSRDQLFGGSWTQSDRLNVRPTLDSLDRTILRRLNDDARASYAKIAFENDVSGTTVSRRVSRLREADVINGFTVSLKPYKAGFETYLLGLPECHLNRSTQRSVARFEEVTFFTSSLGHYDYFLRVSVDDQTHLQDTLNELKELLDHPSVDLHRLVDEPKEVYIPTSIVQGTQLTD